MTGMRCGAAGAALNLLLFGEKLAVGLVTGYVSVTADAFNNLTDCFSSVVSLVSFRVSGKPADKNHPFGHERVEYVASMIVAFVVLLLAWELGVSSVKDIVHPPEIKSLGVVSGAVIGASVLVKFFMFLMNNRFARTLNSGLLKAAALDSLSDVAATSAVLLCAFLSPVIGFNLDGYAGILIALFIARAGIGIIKESVDSIIGVKPDPSVSAGVLDYVKGVDGVLGTHDLIIHQYGPKRAFLSLHVEVDGERDVFANHEMIDSIEMGIYERFGIVATLHMDPVHPEDEFVHSLKDYAANALSSIDERLSLHDFRVVWGEARTNILFDVTKPYEVKTSDGDIMKALDSAFKQLNPGYNTIVVIDREFT